MNSLLVNSNLKYSKLYVNGSKSESNRLLILKSLYKNLSIINISDSDDTNFLENALRTKSSFIDIGHAGTAMRFLTSLFSIQAKSTKTISGSLRMKQRPIKILVDALRNIGAEIAYLEKEGFPPLLIKPSILTGIMEHYSSGKPIIEGKIENKNQITDGDNETIKQIKELIDQRVRPAVAMDGGDIVFCSFEDGVVTLEMKGACAGCPSSTATLKMGIENMLKHYIPEVIEVRAAEPQY